jgi:hypothetical protein
MIYPRGYFAKVSSRYEKIMQEKFSGGIFHQVIMSEIFPKGDYLTELFYPKKSGLQKKHFL